MLKFINSCRCCISVDQLSSDLVLSLYLAPRKGYGTCNAINGRCEGFNGKALKLKTILAESLRSSSGSVTYDVRSCDHVHQRRPMMSKAEDTDFQISSSSAVSKKSDVMACGGYSSMMSGDEGIPEMSRNEPGGKVPADFRVWETVNRRIGRDGNTLKFKVLSYNVLAQYLLEWHPYLYRECSSRCLKWQHRSALILDEIKQLSPDILCLQEVQASHIANFYHKLEQLGFMGVFKQKTGHRQDGCAIYFRKSLFHMKDYVSVEFYQPDLPLLNRDNIGIMVKLVPRCMPDSPFVVATTHLLFNPKRTDVRLAQVQVFLAEIDRFAFSTKTGNGHMPIVLTGDLNSIPDSAVVQLLQCGSVYAVQYREGSDWKKIGVTDNCQHLAVYLNRIKGSYTRVHPTNLMIHHSSFSAYKLSGMHDPREHPAANPQYFNSPRLAHSLELHSVYDHEKGNGEKEATTFQNQWVTVDYIYYSRKNRLNLLERLYLPTGRECEVLDCLPNQVYGSDHLALGAVFELSPNVSLY